MGRVTIGGQAVIEGIMMKNDNRYAIAVRKPDKEIEVKVSDYQSISDRIKIFKLPIIRGVVNFIESLVLGISTLTFSASFYEEEEEEPKKEKKTRKNAKILTPEEQEIKEKKAEKAMMAGTIAFSLVFAIALFMLFPAWVAGMLGKVIEQRWVVAALEGILRIVIFLGYLFLVSRLEDIQRTFMYHGAEHKTIACLEHGEDLTVENVMKHSRFHKRCGTSFLFLVMIISILFFMWIHTDTMWLRLLLRLALVPVIAGVSYEFIRYAGKHESWLANGLSKPGLWLQRLTTSEPTEDMIEVAIRSVEGVFDWRAYLEEQRREKQDDN